MEKEKTRLSQEQFIEEKVKCRHCIRADSLLRDLGEFGRRLGEPSIPPPTSHQPPAFPFHLPPPPTSYLLPSGLLPFAKSDQTNSLKSVQRWENCLTASVQGHNTREYGIIPHKYRHIHSHDHQSL